MKKVLTFCIMALMLACTWDCNKPATKEEDKPSVVTPSDEPSSEAPVSEDPSSEAPVSEDPSSDEPVSADPSGEEPVSDDPVSEDPSGEEPVPEDPVVVSIYIQGELELDYETPYGIIDVSLDQPADRDITLSVSMEGFAPEDLPAINADAITYSRSVTIAKGKTAGTAIIELVPDRLVGEPLYGACLVFIPEDPYITFAAQEYCNVFYTAKLDDEEVIPEITSVVHDAEFKDGKAEIRFNLNTGAPEEAYVMVSIGQYWKQTDSGKTIIPLKVDGAPVITFSSNATYNEAQSTVTIPLEAGGRYTVLTIYIDGSLLEAGVEYQIPFYYAGCGGIMSSDGMKEIYKINYSK
ncbi:MAG: hypothetical protein IJ795_04105 [Bacteroidales bacterium]|nr:hypothetical protein [Bacteroidales bacterium]